jgi:CubicO group peptidase (beta-lactamase class C family)
MRMTTTGFIVCCLQTIDSVAWKCQQRPRVRRATHGWTESVMVRVLAPMAAILFACRAVVALQPQDAEPSRDLQGFVNEMRSTQRLPGLVVVVVRSDGQPRVYVSGERRIGKGDPITPTDRMHLGSLTKAITATVIGALTEQHRMTLETTIGQTFPELSAKMQPAYRDVNVRQLLTHSGGVPAVSHQRVAAVDAGSEGHGHRTAA